MRTDRRQRTAVLFPSSVNFLISASVNVLLPAPGGPVMPIMGICLCASDFKSSSAPGPQIFYHRNCPRNYMKITVAQVTNACRCSTYHRVRQAIHRAADMMKATSKARAYGGHQPPRISCDRRRSSGRLRPWLLDAAEGGRPVDDVDT